MRITCGWFSDAVMFASLRKRPTCSSSVRRSASSTLIATGRPSPRCSARCTAPNPPDASSRRCSNFSAQSPGTPAAAPQWGAGDTARYAQAIGRALTELAADAGAAGGAIAAAGGQLEALAVSGDGNAAYWAAQNESLKLRLRSVAPQLE